MVGRSLWFVFVVGSSACNPATDGPAPSDAAPGASTPTETPPSTATSTAASTAPQAAAGAPSTDDEATLYAIGIEIGRSLQPFSLTPAEVKAVEAGLEDTVAGRPPRVDLEVQGPKIQAFAEARVSAAAAANTASGAQFLATLAATPGATVSPTGVVYVEVAAGTGPQPTVDDTVQVHYRGTLPNGHEFDSSYRRGAPATFSLGEVVPCWTEGLQKLKVGGKAKLGCPSALAYGDAGMGEIPPGSALQFEVELLAIEGR